MKSAMLRKPYQLLFVVLTVVTVYYSTIFAEILNVDDERLITDLFNMEHWSLKGLFLPGGGGYYYRPLLYLSFIADKYLWGPHESFMHLENLLLHATCSVLVFFITDRLAARYGMTAPAAPLAAALLFGLHPLATESVNWISGRTDPMAGAFLLGSVLLLIKYLDNGSPFALVGAGCAFIGATLVKETALFWFPAGLFFVYCHRRADNHRTTDAARRSLFHVTAPYLILCLSTATYFGMRHLAYRRGDGGIQLAVKGAVAANHEMLDKLRIFSKVFGFYLKKLVVPFPLNFAIVSVSNWYVPLGVAGFLCCCYLLWRRSVTGALLLMAACIISPALLVPSGRMAWTPVAERYLYMPVAFVVIAAVLFCARHRHRLPLPSAMVTVLATLLIATSGYATYERNLVWQHNLTLFQDCVAKSPDFIPARNELARSLENAGRLEEAKQIYRSINLPGSDKYLIIAEINRARSLAMDNDYRGAIAGLEKLRYTSSQPFYRDYLKMLLFLYGKLEESEKNGAKAHALRLRQIELTRDLQAHSGDPLLLYRIGQLYLGVKDEARAADYFRQAADKAPSDAFYREPARKLAARLGNGNGSRK